MAIDFWEFWRAGDGDRQLLPRAAGRHGVVIDEVYDL